MPASAIGRVTLLDVAREAGVSKSTVSLVLQVNPVVRPETRERVQRAIERLGYVHHRGAATLRRQKGDVVGIVINNLIDPFFAELAVGIERGLVAAGGVPFLATTGENPARQARMMRTMRAHGAAGFIVCPAFGTELAFLCEVEDWQLPMVPVMRRIPRAHASYVGPDNRHDAERATTHLLAAGHRRVAFLGGRHGAVVREERLEGYASALRAAGLPVDTTVVVEAVPSREGGRAALEQILAYKDPPTAALCFNDVVAFGVLHGLVLHGL